VVVCDCVGKTERKSRNLYFEVWCGHKGHKPWLAQPSNLLLSHNWCRDCFTSGKINKTEKHLLAVHAKVSKTREDQWLHGQSPLHLKHIRSQSGRFVLDVDLQCMVLPLQTMYDGVFHDPDSDYVKNMRFYCSSVGKEELAKFERNLANTVANDKLRRDAYGDELLIITAKEYQFKPNRLDPEEELKLENRIRSYYQAQMVKHGLTVDV